MEKILLKWETGLIWLNYSNFTFNIRRDKIIIKFNQRCLRVLNFELVSIKDILVNGCEKINRLNNRTVYHKLIRSHNILRG